MDTFTSIVDAAFGTGAIGYIMAGLLLLVVSVWTFRSSNRNNRVGYVFGILLAVLIVNLYFATNGDNALFSLIGQSPRDDLYMPAFFGLILGFAVLFPFNRPSVPGAMTAVLAIATASCLLLIFFIWRAGQSDPLLQVIAVIVYRQRFMGAFAAAFVVGVFAHFIWALQNLTRAKRQNNK